MKRYPHDGYCPCKCGREVPSGSFWATEKCGRAVRDARKRRGLQTVLCDIGGRKTEIKQKKRRAVERRQNAS